MNKRRIKDELKTNPGPQKSTRKPLLAQRIYEVKNPCFRIRELFGIPAWEVMTGQAGVYPWLRSNTVDRVIMRK